jgi:hypothetical protein
MECLSRADRQPTPTQQQPIRTTIDPMRSDRIRLASTRRFHNRLLPRLLAEVRAVEPPRGIEPRTCSLRGDRTPPTTAATSNNTCSVDTSGCTSGIIRREFAPRLIPRHALRTTLAFCLIPIEPERALGLCSSLLTARRNDRRAIGTHGRNRRCGSPRHTSGRGRCSCG